MKSRTSPLDRVLGRLDDLDEVNLGILVQRLAKDRRLLETIFDVIRDGILVLDGVGSIQYANLQGRRLIGLKESSIGKVKVARAAPEIARALGLDRKDGFPEAMVVTRELGISYPDFRYVRLYAVPIEEDQVEDCKGNRSLAVVLSDITEDKVSTDELIGGYDEKKGVKYKIEGYLEEFALSKNEADDLIINARNIVFK